MLTTAEFIASTVTVMSVMTVSSLGIDMWVCQVKDSTFYNATTQTNTKQLQVSYVTLFTKLILQTEYTKECLPHKGINMAGKNRGDVWV